MESLLFSTLCLLLFFSYSQSSTVLVSTDCTDQVSSSGSYQCYDINDALMLASANDQLLIEPGLHTLTVPIIIEDLYNISLYSSSSSLSSIIHCSPNIGLIFYNVTNLYIEGLSFVQCRANASQLEYISEALGELEINISPLVGVGLIIANAVNVILHRTTVRDTPGLGLLGINMMGVVAIVDCDFINNKSPLCHTYVRSIYYPEAELIGGGAHLYYQDNDMSDRVYVHVAYSRFHGNQGCNTNHVGSFLGDIYPTLRSAGYRPGEGGLLLMIAQDDRDTFSIAFSVQYCNFTSNRGTFGSGLTIWTFSASRYASFYISDCLFRDNGRVPNHIDSHDQYLFIGGAIGINLDILRLREVNFDFEPFDLRGRNVSIIIHDCTFVNNSAYVGGAIGLYSLKLTQSLRYEDIIIVYFIGCVFIDNTATVGGASFLKETKIHGSEVGLYIVLKDNLVNTTTLLTHLNEVGDIAYTSGAIDVETLLLDVYNLTISNTNGGSGIVLMKSGIFLDTGGSLILNNNTGLYGGGMQFLDYSYIFFKDHSSLIFTNNTGLILGGGIYVNHDGYSPDVVYDDCFIGSIGNISEFRFIGNVAPLGNVMYGSALETCSWATAAQKEYNITANNTFVLLTMLFTDRISVISTEPQFAINTPTHNISILMDDQISDVFRAIPGQTLQLNMKALDRLTHTLSVAISSTQKRNVARLGRSGYWFLDGNDSSVPLTVYGSENEDISVTIFTTDSYANNDITIILEECTPGFVYNATAQSCICAPQLSQYNIKCNIDNLSVAVPNDKWFGLLDSDLNATIDNLVVGYCGMDYCASDGMVIVNGSFNDQCDSVYNRIGLFCGQCKEGYSLVLSGSKCKPCSNWYSLAVIPLFLLSGLFLAILLVYFRVTITGGLINGFLFFENIGQLYTYQIFPSLHYVYPFQLMQFTCGFELCFYDGFTVLHRAVFYLLYPVYLFILMGLTYTAAKRFTCLSKYGSEISKAFVTLIIICYVQLTEVSTSLLSPLTFWTLSGDEHVHWQFDPTVKYFSGAHAFLVVIAILILVFYTLTLPLVLLYPPLLYKSKYFNYFKPLFDALWSPFKPQFRFWLSFKLLIRLLLFLFAKFMESPLNLFLTIIFLFFFLLLEIHIQPFKGKWRNKANAFFTGNLTLILIITQFFNAYDYSDAAQLIAVIPLVSLAYLSLVPIIFYHLSFKWPQLKNISCPPLWFSKLWINIKEMVKERRRKRMRSDIETETEMPSPPPILKMSDMSKYRESVFNYEDELMNESTRKTN